MNLSKEGKNEIALALILWRDFKSGGKFDFEAAKRMFELAKHLDISSELEQLLSKVPPMKIKPRHS